MWRRGDLLQHRHSPELGPGRVVEVLDRAIVVEFPRSRRRLRMAADSVALLRVDVAPGLAVEVGPDAEPAIVAATLPDGRVELVGGRQVAREEVWPAVAPRSALDDLAEGKVAGAEDVALRLAAMRLAEIQDADGLGSFLGGKVLLFPHQLHAALGATRADPVRWLLADEVGLGKTVEACLVADHLVRAGRARKVLVVAPETLTVQWLGELWRKYHQVFVLLDGKRLADVAKDFGKGFNPFDAHPRSIVGLATLVDKPELTAQAVAAGIDLLVVDEAHHLRRPAGHPGNPAYRAVAPIAALGRHVLLLTAVPLEDDAHGFFRLLQLLRPEELPEDVPVEERLARREPLPPCTSATRRADIGGLPPRRSEPIDLQDPAGWQALADLESAVRRMPAEGPLARQAKVQRLARALGSGAAVASPGPLSDLAQRAAAMDPRTVWLLDQAAGWRARREKTLVFVAHRETLEMLKTALRREHHHVGTFHEDLSPGQRDIEVAQFRLDSGPDILVSTECGGEGRNFQFCHRLVLFDLPWSPMAVEQRIGRLDRIGRTTPVVVSYFRPPHGLAAAIAKLYEDIGIFREPLGGLLRELAHIEEAVEEAALANPEVLAATLLPSLVTEARGALERVRAAAHHQLHRDRFTPAEAPDILRRIPADLEELTERVVLSACERLGIGAERQRGRRTFAIEIGATALVDGLPGVPGGASFLGSFSRDEAVEMEALDYYGSSHPIVEGLLADMDDHDRYRAGAAEMDGEPAGFGLVAAWRRGRTLDLAAVDARGRPRPEWIAALRDGSGKLRPAPVPAGPDWSELVRGLASRLPHRDPPRVALALRVVSPRGRRSART